MPTFDYHAIRAEGDEEKSFVGGIVVARSRQEAKEKLRERGLSAILALGNRGLKAQLKLANRLGARYTVIVGEGELAEGKVQVRDMARSSQELVPCDDVTTLLPDLLESGSP